MACSKELRIPKEWLKYHYDIVKEPIDPELFSEDEAFAWVKDIGLTHEKSDVKRCQEIRPFHCMRHQMVLSSRNDAFCKKVFKLWAHLLVAIYISDDIMETTSEFEMQQVCEAVQFLADQTREQLPRFPTINEMKQSLSLHCKIDEKWIPHAIYYLDFANKVAKLLNQQGEFSVEDVNDYWRRLVVLICHYYEGLAMEVKHIVRSYSEDVWTRLFTASTLVWIILQEIVSGAVGKTSEIASHLHELYFLYLFYSVGTNDIYSYFRETELDDSANILKSLLVSKEVCTESEAVLKCVEILNAAAQMMYKKIEKIKLENPANQELLKLLDSIGMAAAGWFFWNHYSPRFAACPWRLPTVEVQEDELKEWRECDEEPMKELSPFLLKHSPKAKKISDGIIAGVVRMHSYLSA